MSEFSFKPAVNAEPARWLEERLRTFGEDVSSVAPSGFEAYARVVHPAERVARDSITPIRWAEVAELTGRTAHRAMQWLSLCGEGPIIYDESVLKVGDAWARGPEIGTLPLSVSQILWRVLEHHTQSRDNCFFAVWEGFGCLPRLVLTAPVFGLPARKFHLFTGPLEAVEQSFCSTGPRDMTSRSVMVAVSSEKITAEKFEEALANLPPFKNSPLYQSANLWWPEDCAWCAHTEIDFDTTYIAGTQALVNAILEHLELEAYQVEPTDTLADTINPPPADPYGGSFKLES